MERSLIFFSPTSLIKSQHWSLGQLQSWCNSRVEDLHGLTPQLWWQTSVWGEVKWNRKQHHKCLLLSAVMHCLFALSIHRWKLIHSWRFHTLKPVRNYAESCLPLTRKCWSSGWRFLISKAVQKPSVFVNYILHVWWIKRNLYKFVFHDDLYFLSGRNVLRRHVLTQMWEKFACNSVRIYKYMWVQDDSQPGSWVFRYLSCKTWSRCLYLLI